MDDIAAAGGLKGRVQREALDLVDAFARGESPAPEALVAARASVRKFNGRIGAGSPPLLVALSWVPVEPLLDMVEQGDDLTRGVLEQAQAAVVGPPEQARTRVSALFEEAKACVIVGDTAPAPGAHG